MKTIYKYQIPTARKFDLDLPDDYKILSVQIQNEEPVMWALIDTENRIKKEYFQLILTGSNINNVENLSYIDSFQVSRYDGIFIFHLFKDNK